MDRLGILCQSERTLLVVQGRRTATLNLRPVLGLLLVIESEEIVYKAEHLEPKIINRLQNIKSQLKTDA